MRVRHDPPKPDSGRKVVLAKDRSVLDDLCTAYAWLQINGFILRDTRLDRGPLPPAGGNRGHPGGPAVG